MTIKRYKFDPQYAKELWEGLPDIEPPLITVSNEPLDVLGRLLKASQLARLLTQVGISWRQEFI